MRRHKRQTQCINALGRQGQANQTTAMFSHEIDRIRRGHLSRNYEVTLIFAVFMVDKNEHTTVAGVVDDIFSRADRIGQILLNLAGCLKNLCHGCP